MSLLEQLCELETSRCYEDRIAYLRSTGRDTQIIETGIQDVVERLDGGNKSFVIYGEPQSGKTEVMIALTCKLIDIGYQTIFILMNDNIDLEEQNFTRFHECQEFSISPIKDTQLVELETRHLKAGRQRVIFCRKNSKNLQKLITATRHMEDCILLDDEADFATPDRNINKELEENSKINQCVGKLLHTNREDSGVYIGVTATPGRLDLNNTFYNDWKNWVFLDPFEEYKGRRFFFPIADEDKSKSDYQLVKLPPTGDSPTFLNEAIMRFLIRVAYLNMLKPNERDKTYSMLIHTAGEINDHIKDEATVNKLLFKLDSQDSEAAEKLWERLYAQATKIIDFDKVQFAAMDLLKYIKRNLGRSDIVVINSKTDKTNVDRALNPRALFTFAIGGNIVSRGLTFNNLLTFFFSRNVKGKMQQNTYIQRARMFGYRPYSKHFELCVPADLFQTWASCFEQHEISLSLARAGDYVHIHSSATAAADSTSIDKKHVINERTGERTAGDVFQYSDIIDQRLKDPKLDPLTIISQLQDDGLIPDSAFASPFMSYIKERSLPNHSDVVMVLIRSDRSVQYIESYKDGDVGTLMRERKGTIQAITHKVSEYDKARHFICPIRNQRGQARFLYLGNLGEHILLNTLQSKT